LPIDQRAKTIRRRECAGQELNLQCPEGRVGYSHLGTPMPSRRI